MQNYTKLYENYLFLGSVYFIAIDDDKMFTKIDLTSEQDIQMKEIYQQNTYKCLQKTLKLIEKLPEQF